jgi:general secretion pathway protein C
VEDPNAGVAEEGEKVPEFDPKAIPCPTCECEESEAKLGLLATMVAEPSVWSMAIIDDSESRESRLVKEEQEVADHIVKAIQRDRVVLASKSSGKVGCVELGKKAAGAKRYAPPRSAAGSATSGTRSDVKEGVKKVGANAYEIDRGMLNEQLEDLSALSRQARVIPHYRGGKPQGFKIVGVRPGSLYSHIGLRSGDVIKGVNDEEITTPNKALELYEKLKNSDNVSVDIERRGRKTKLEYTIK